MTPKLGFVLILTLIPYLYGCTVVRPCTAEHKYPFWVRGISNVTSRMLTKNLYWQDKIAKGRSTQAEERELIASNTRFFAGLIEYIKACVEYEAIQEESKNEIRDE